MLLRIASLIGKSIKRPTRSNKQLETRQRTSSKFVPSLNLQDLEDRVALTATPIKVPLELVDISKPGDTPTYKLGIMVGLGGAEPRLYEFDTGGKAFWAASSPYIQPTNWGDTKVLQQNSLHTTYSSGNQYTANLVSTKVALYDPVDLTVTNPIIETADPVRMGQITKFTSEKPGKQAEWYNDLKNGIPPLENHFYGDFGASLAPAKSDKGTYIFSILTQFKLPEGLKPGFIVHLGSLGKDSAPWLQIGLAETDIQSFDTQLKMNQYNCSLRSPVSGVPMYKEQITNADFKWDNPALPLPDPEQSQSYKNLGWTIDTGAPEVNVWQGNIVKVHKSFIIGHSKTGEFKPDREFMVHAQPVNSGGTPFDMKFTTGDKPCVNKVVASQHKKSKTGVNYVNTGLLTFVNYDVMFNPADGRVGFRTPQNSDG